MKKKFDPQYIANCRKQIARAMKDETPVCEFRMCDIMIAASNAFGNSSDAEVSRMKVFLIEMNLCLLEKQQKRPDAGTKEYVRSLFDESSRVNADILDELKRIVSHFQEIVFSHPVITPVLDEDLYYEEVSINSLRWDEDQHCIKAIDNDGSTWDESGFLPSSITQFLDRIIDQGLYPKS